MKVLTALLFVLATFKVASAQPSPAPQIRYVTADPTGQACSNTAIALLTPNGTLYTCQSGVYAAAGGGGGGGGTGNAGANVSVANSATPTFTCPSSTAGTVVNFHMASALATNITSSTLSGCTGSASLASLLTFEFVQDGSGAHTVAMPTGFGEACQISSLAGATTNMSGMWDGTTFHAFPCQSSGVGFGAETAAPGVNPPSGYEFCWNDSTGLFPRCLNSAGTTFQMAKEGTGCRQANGANAVDTFVACGGATATAPFLINIPQYLNIANITVPQLSAGTSPMFLLLFTPMVSQTWGSITHFAGGSGSNHYAFAAFPAACNTSPLATSSVGTFAGQNFYALTFSVTFTAGTSYYIAVSSDSSNGTDVIGTLNNSAALGGVLNLNGKKYWATSPASGSGSVAWSGGVPTWPSTCNLASATAKVSDPFFYLPY